MIKVFNNDEIIDLAVKGYSATEIIEQLGLSITPRQVQRIVKPYRSPYRRAGRRADDDSSTMFKDIVLATMVKIGMNPHKCEQCGKHSERRMDIHHTKYSGATVYDLQFVCRRCNLAPRNVR